MHTTPEFLYVGDDENIYFADTNTGYYNYIVKYDVYNNIETSYYKPFANNYGCKVYDGYMYYVSNDGMRKMSLNDTSINDLISDEYKMYDMAMSSNGLLFARAKKVKDDNILGDDYYIVTDVYGINVRILDRHENDFNS